MRKKNMPANAAPPPGFGFCPTCICTNNPKAARHAMDLFSCEGMELSIRDIVLLAGRKCHDLHTAIIHHSS